jgi:transposase
MGATCGIDWASDWHDVHIADEHGELLVAEQFSHDERGISAPIELLGSREVECCAIERPDGLLVGRLLAAGIVVLAIHPNQVKAARDRFRAAAGKNDRFDAFVLCELARTDRHRFPVLAPCGDETLALKALVRTREELVDARVALANQLRAQLQAFWAGAERMFADVDSQIALAFLERYPSPSDARGLGEKRLESFLARHGYSGRRPPAELLARLRSAPAAVVGELEQDARRAAVIGLLCALRPIVEQINRARYPTDDALAADAGQAPVTIQSGKHSAATFRWACDKRLRKHMGTLADSTRHWHPWAHDVYQRARARGCDHPHAIRILGRAWTRVLWRCWQDHTPYDPTRHKALNKILAQGG